MKPLKTTVMLMAFIMVLGACNPGEDSADNQSYTEVDDNQLPISAIRTDSSSDESGSGTQQIGFEDGRDNNSGLRRDNQNDNFDGFNGSMRNQGPLSNGNARDPGREQDMELQERNQERQNRLQPDQNQLEEPDQSEGNQAQQQPGSQNDSQGQSQQGMNEYSSKVINLTNEKRRENGLSELKASKPLSEVARNKSEDMQEKNYFSHTSPTYGSPFNMMKEFDVTFESAGENIARGQQSPQQVVNAWMESTEHRENILNGSFTHIGVGYIEEGSYWTQMFIEK